MKRLFLSLVVLAIAGSAFAQDVYVAGSTSHASSRALITKNGQDLHQAPLYGPGDSNLSTMVVVDPDTKDVYWIVIDDFLIPTISVVYKNEAVYLDISRDGSFVNSIAIPNPGHSLYSGGYVINSGIKTAVVWVDNNTTPAYVLGDGQYNSSVLGMHVVDHGDVYCCGFQDHEVNSYGLRTGMIWKLGSSTPVVAKEYMFFSDVEYYNGHIYSVGYTGDTPSGAHDLVVYEDDDLLFTLLTENADCYALDNGQRAAKIMIEGGDIYVSGCDRSNNGYIWKNGVLLYEFEANRKTPCDVVANGVFYGNTNDSPHYVYQNGQSLYQIYGWYPINDIFVAEECHSNNARTLPYYEGFDTGNSDWLCWIKTDEGMNWDSDHEITINSYWHRLRYEEGPDNYCVFHNYNNAYNQEGWLISPRIAIRSGMDAQLTFKTREQYPNDIQFEGVLVSTTGTGPSDFEVVWTQDNGSGEWKDVMIDLTQYNGKEIYVAFKYKGLNANTWFIDDVNITEFLGLEDVASQSLTIYPNPAKDKVGFKGAEGVGTVDIYNSLGKKVKTVVIDNNGEIDVRELASGLYLVRCGNTSLQFVKE